jgi:peptidoglycan/xylan/chitin deacetylase (PgdA/CDA1 family)
LKADWEFMGHGYVQGPMHKVEDQVKAIDQTMQSIKNFTGKAPVGWESPGLTETDDTLDYLSAAGISYVANWVLDDLPTWLHAKPKPVLAVPYTVELNDIPMMALQNHRSEEMYHRGVLQLDRLWRDAATIPRMMAISVHPYITGVPHRIDAFEKLLDAVLAKPEVQIMTGEKIAQWYTSQVPASAALK